MSGRSGIASLVVEFPHRVLSRSNFGYLAPYVAPERAELLLAGAPQTVRRATAEDAMERMSVACGRKAAAAAGIPMENIDFLITCEIGATGQPIATLIQHELGLSPTVPVQSIQNGACGMIDALACAASLVATGLYRNVLVIATSIWDIRGEGLIDPTDPTYALFGDASCGAVVSANGRLASLLAHRSATDGSAYACLGALLRDRLNPSLSSFAPVGSEQIHRGAYIDISDEGIAWMQRAAPQLIAQCVEDALGEAEIAKESVRWACWQPFGAAGQTWQAALESALPNATLVDSFAKYGWTGPAGPLLPLLTTLENSAPGECIAIVGVAEGGQASTLLIEAQPRRE